MRALLIPLLAAAIVSAALAQSEAPPGDDRVTRYTEASRLARAGHIERALEQFDALARDFPAWVPASRALGLLAAEAGGETAETWRAELRQRVRRLRRDIAASVALSILERARGRVPEAHRLLLTAITAGARSPLLVPMLLDTTSDRAGLAGWFDLRASVLPGDGAFEAMRARLLLTDGRLGRARKAIETALAAHPDDPDLLALGARLARASGATDLACARAALAAGQLPPREVPEIRVPRRLWLARAFIACGQPERGRSLLSGLGPAVVPPGSDAGAAAIPVVRAELELSIGEPLLALSTLPEEAELDPFWREVARAVRIGARVRAGAGPGDEARRLPAEPLPAGLALAERARALAALAAEAADRPALARAARAAGDKLRALSLDPAGRRLLLLGAALAGEPAPAALAKGEDPDLAVATRILAATQAPGTIPETDPLLLARAHGRLAARLRAIAARALDAAGERAQAVEIAREALLDLEEADRAGRPLPPALAVLAGDPDAQALELAALAATAAEAGGLPRAVAVGRLVRDLGQIVRRWSTRASPWPDRPEGWAPFLPECTCLVLAARASGGPAVTLSGGGPIWAGSVEDAGGSPPCTAARVIVWLGPAPAPGGLALPGDRRPLLRWTGPTERNGASGAARARSPGRLVGPGRDRPLRRTVERLAAAPPPGAAAATAEGGLFVGAGLAMALSPLASGWLVPPGGDDPLGWCDPDSLQRLPPGSGGLMALGVRATGSPPAPEKGAWVLAESALATGRSWLLLSRRPLGPEEISRLEARWSRWQRDPAGEAARLLVEAPELANALMLWGDPALAAHGAERPWRTIGAALLAAALLAAGGLFLLRRRRAR